MTIAAIKAIYNCSW